ncbi:hypothetical protein CJD36_000985 [Flavipsychrobacter stenotrophus]|uniref:Phage integrase SAM-like domain-containing protein n=1 Tax=Flavipsychrobacter stenotrophus TaxID=2077091 RepID=A0A2S7SZI1_9BACT|nr:hypothetical protein [Flavipsychrobacter stenotrophus]PQJ12359.1 hypothetical protein CJD36_000985 [Flavipsychrobacter stenotrophus]
MSNEKNYIDIVKSDKNDSTATLYLRSKGRDNNNKKSLKIKVSCELFRKHFNHSEQRFKSQMPSYKMLNDAIQRAYEEVDNHDGEIKSIPKDSKSFIKYWEKLIKNGENHGTNLKHSTVLKKLKLFLKSNGKDDLKFNEITACEQLTNAFINHRLKGYYVRC